MAFEIINRHVMVSSNAKLSSCSTALVCPALPNLYAEISMVLQQLQAHYCCADVNGAISSVSGLLGGLGIGRK